MTDHEMLWLVTRNDGHIRELRAPTRERAAHLAGWSVGECSRIEPVNALGILRRRLLAGDGLQRIRDAGGIPGVGWAADFSQDDLDYLESTDLAAVTDEALRAMLLAIAKE